MPTPSYKQTLSGGLEIDQFYVTTPSKLLLKINEEKFSGKVVVQNPDDDFVTWHIYLGKGKIHYATSSIGLKERCDYLIDHYGFGDICDFHFPKDLIQDYSYFYQLWKDKILTFEQIRAICECLTSEALLHILALPRSRCILIADVDLPSPILNLDINQSIETLEDKVQYWSSLKPGINSPFQRPLIHDWLETKPILEKSGKYSNDWLQQLYKALSNVNCLYEIAKKTKTSSLDLSILFAQLVETEQATMLPYQDIVAEDGPHIIYVDDHPVSQRIVAYSLEAMDFRVTVISDPNKALIALQEQKVDLAIIGAEMKEIDGFQLTQLCRQVPELESLPIILIMEAGKSLVHEIKAKISRASGYIRKPFLPQELIAKVEQYLPEKARTF